MVGGLLGGAEIGPKSSAGYRTVLPLSLFLTGIITILFPLAATNGVTYACLDRFCLGLLEGLLLPAAMAGVSATTSSSPPPYMEYDESTLCENEIISEYNIKATSSALVIAGCYLGSAWAYVSAWILFSERFQLQLAKLPLLGFDGSIWPVIFYINGVLSILCLFLFRDEFNIPNTFGSAIKENRGYDEINNTDMISTKTNSLWDDTISLAMQTLQSKSGRAILAAQIGQGALLYSIASWGPLYLERVNTLQQHTDQSTTAVMDVVASSAQSELTVSYVAVAASLAASSLILPQITQALVGVSIGAIADQLSSKIGTRITRRSLQLISGVVPAIVLLYLSQIEGSEVNTANDLLSPAFLFGTAQTISALSLGAVSVSHLDIATSKCAGVVYAFENVAAAASGSLMVNIFGRLLDDSSSTTAEISLSGNDFSLPFQVVAILSAVGSLIYGLTVETELEIGSNQTATMK